MKRTSLSLALFAVLISSAAAAEVQLGDADIQKVLSDATLVGAEPAAQVEQIFQASGVTLYIESGAQSQGFWRVENGKYCSVWPPSEHWSCYNVTRDGPLITFISSSGTRTPMRLKQPAQ